MSEPASTKPSPKTRRPLMFVVLGIFLFSAAGWLVSDRLRVHTTIPIPPSYDYRIRQGVNQEVHYRGSSFFEGTPGASNTAYLLNLTDRWTARFSYDLRANDAIPLSYQYSAVAMVRGTYGSPDSDAGQSNVWSKSFKLLEPTAGVQTTDHLSLEPEIIVPFDEYKKAIDQFKLALNVPVNTELVVTYTIRVAGKVDGTPFEDTKVSSISAPLDQQIYTLTTKFAKTDHHEVVPKQSQRLEDIITRYEAPLALLLTLLGLGYTIYGLRRQIIKSPYQRELEKIYRYHDGIIIHASRPTDLVHKDVVMVRKFDDLLNLEEELKTPIIASQISDVTTHFFIARDDLVYVYTLGEPVSFRPQAKAPVAPTTPAPKPPAPKRKVMG